jgi:hypothetical protein
MFAVRSDPMNSQSVTSPNGSDAFSEFGDTGPWKRAIGPFLQSRRRDPFVVSLAYGGMLDTPVCCL